MQGLAIPENCKGVTAQAIAHGLANRHDCRCGDGGVNRVAASVQHGQPGLRAQRVRGRDDVAGEERNARAGVRVLKIEIHSSNKVG